MDAPLVYCVVITWNGRAHLGACFESLLTSVYENARFLLVDNASEDGSPDFVRDNFGRDPRVEILTLPRNVGWSRGNNEGIRRALEAGAEYVFLLNDDTWTAPDALCILAERSEAEKQIGALAPKMVLFDTPEVLNSVGLQCSIVGACWDIGLGRLDAPRWNESRQVIGACGGACWLRAGALRKTGLLPTDYDIYLDDLDLCLRIWNAGYEIWSEPRAVVRHKFSATMGEGARARQKYYLNTRNRLRLIQRCFPVSKAAEIVPALLEGEARALGRAALDRQWWKIGQQARSWLAAAAYTPRALTARREMRRAGLEVCRFWHLLVREPLFFPGAETPKEGWYAPRVIGGARMRPMSRRATLRSPGGILRIRHANCYPELGATRIILEGEGVTPMILETRDVSEVELSSRPGSLQFSAQFIFGAEETGELVDFGGWLSVRTASGQDLLEEGNP